MQNVIETAKTSKARALLLRDRVPPDFEAALRLLREAEHSLRSELAIERAERGSKGLAEKFEEDLALQLTHIQGSTGGVFRRQGISTRTAVERTELLRESVRAYDAGYKIEQEYRAKKDSYTLVQRLVGRVMLDPSAPVVENLRVSAALVSALAHLREQTKKGGVREKDEYAFSDLSLVSLLLGQDDWLTELKRFIAIENATHAINATREVLRDLRMLAGDSLPASADLIARLDAALDLFPVQPTA